MTGPEHFRQAEDLAAKAGEYLGQGDGQASAAVWAAVAQVHATLALAAATAGGADAWREVLESQSRSDVRGGARDTAPPMPPDGRRNVAHRGDPARRRGRG